MKIAILDDGIHTDSTIYVKQLDFDMQCMQGEVRPRELPVQTGSHGTIVAELVQAFAPKAEIGSVKVLPQGELGHIRDIIQAVKWCVSYGVDAIHMSIGTVQWQDFFELEHEIRPLALDIRMVAARNNREQFSMPSGLPGVWDVGFLACGGPVVEEKQGNAWSISTNLRIPKKMSVKYGEGIGISNSYQAAAVTGFLAGAELLLKDSSKEVLLEAFAKSTATADAGILYADRKKTIPDRMADTPIVWIWAKQEEEKEIRRLLEEFHRNDYYAMAVTDWIGYEQWPETIFWHSIDAIDALNRKEMSRIVETYQCDLLLVVASMPDVAELADITLKVDGQVLQLCEGEQIKSETVRGNGWWQDAVDMVCQYYG